MQIYAGLFCFCTKISTHFYVWDSSGTLLWKANIQSNRKVICTLRVKPYSSPVRWISSPSLRTLRCSRSSSIWLVIVVYIFITVLLFVRSQTMLWAGGSIRPDVCPDSPDGTHRQDRSSAKAGSQLLTAADTCFAPRHRSSR